jgi:hypothetical protein
MIPGPHPSAARPRRPARLTLRPASLPVLLAVAAGVIVAVPSGAATSAAASPSTSTSPSASPSTSTAAETGALAVGLPDEIAAGGEASVTVSGATGSTVSAMAVGSLGTWTGEADVRDGSATLDLPSSLLEVAGVVTVVVRDGDATASAETRVAPGDAVAPVQTVVGARSIVADAADIAMAVVIPVDRYGNAVAAGTPVDVTRVTPLGETQPQTVRTSGLLAFADVLSGTRAGQSELWSQVAGVSGPSATLQEVPGRPVAFTIASAAPGQAGVPGADGRSLTPVQTSVLADAFGNVMPDGTEVELRWTGPGGQGSSTAETIAGVASFWIEAPAASGDIALTAYARGLASDTITIAYGVAVDAVPFSAATTDAGTVSVDIGPVAQVDGRYVADGTLATVQVREADGTVGATGSVRLYGGVASLELVPAGPATSVEVSVLGATGTEAVR